jgi:hypothetical protein
VAEVILCQNDPTLVFSIVRIAIARDTGGEQRRINYQKMQQGLA